MEKEFLSMAMAMAMAQQLSFVVFCYGIALFSFLLHGGTNTE